MARPATHSKTELLAKLSAIFRADGFEGASMQALSQKTGLSKASLYHHFPGGKQEMAQKVLGEEGRRLQSLVLRPLTGDDPVLSLIESLQGIETFYAGAVPQCLMNSIMLGKGGDLFGDTIATAVAVWRTRLASAYGAAGAVDDEAVAWAAYAIERIQGSLILCRVEASRQPLERCLKELRGDVDFLKND